MLKHSVISRNSSYFTGRFAIKAFIGVVILGALLGCQSGESCHKVLKAKCVECHSTATSCAKIGQSEEWWLRTIDAMVQLGADVSKHERKVLAECLSNPSEANEELICK